MRLFISREKKKRGRRHSSFLILFSDSIIIFLFFTQLMKDVLSSLGPVKQEANKHRHSIRILNQLTTSALAAAVEATKSHDC